MNGGRHDRSACGQERMQTQRPPVRRHKVPPLAVGESPVWNAAERTLYFIDVLGPTLFRLDPATDALQSWQMPAAIGSFGFCVDGRAIVALRTGVHLFDFATGRLDLLSEPEPDSPENRLNDGKVGPDGRFWVGSMHDMPERLPRGGLYRIDRDGVCTRMLSGLTVSNGLAWSPDGRTMWHSDTRQLFVRCYDYDPSQGTIGPARVVATMDNAAGRPDGAAVDVEGCYWSGGVSAGCLNRIAPDGTLLLRVELPVAGPTMPCFGGPDLRTLYVTSLRTDRTGVDEWGTLISLQAEVAGTPVGRFG